ncbi:MAG: hypothetical protein MRY83_19275 [Flavobacteriales bacterium]|nr:hypothetical protein [Flavobacteriales bacterium]
MRDAEETKINMKLFNLTYNNPEIDSEIDKIVGKRFGFLQALKKGGTGSPKLYLLSGFQEIEALIHDTSNLNRANIEACENGIIIRFRVRLETYGVPISRNNIDSVLDDVNHDEFASILKLKFKTGEIKLGVKKYERNGMIRYWMKWLS